MNNKNARAAALQYEFNNLMLSSCASMDVYCQKIQDLANQLGDVDHPVSESSRVLQLVQGLPKEYEVVGTMINQLNPTWEAARDMLHLETQRQHATVRATSTVLAAQSERPSNRNQNRTAGYQGKNYDPNYYANRGHGQNDHGRGRNQNQRGRGRGSNSYGQNQANWNQNQWTPPPSPYPTARYGPAQFQQGGTSGQRWNGQPMYQNHSLQ